MPATEVQSTSDGYSAPQRPRWRNALARSGGPLGGLVVLVLAAVHLTQGTAGLGLGDVVRSLLGLDQGSTASAVPPITPYLVMRVGQAPLVPYAAPGSDRLAENVAGLPGRFRAALLANHGSLVAADDAAGALEGAVELEEASRIVVALQGREFSVLSAEDVRELTLRYGTTWDL